MDSIAAEKQRVLKELAKRDLSYFCEYVGADGGPWLRSPHLNLLCSQVDSAIKWIKEEHDTRKLIIVSMPPRMGKSQVVTRCTPSYFLGNCPDKEMIVASHSAKMSNKFSAEARKIFKEIGGPLFGLELSQETQNVNQWILKGHYGKMQAGAAGSILGLGAHLAIVDDPTKEMAEAESPLEQEKLLTWHMSSLWSRIAPGGVILVVMSRLHSMDYVGMLLREAKNTGLEWELISLPAQATEDNDILGRMKGDWLWPDRFPAAAMEQIKQGISNERIWQAMYQQNPTSDSSKALWKYGLIDSLRVNTHGNLYRVIVSWDPAMTSKKTSDKHGIFVLATGVPYFKDVSDKPMTQHEKHGYVIEDLSGIYSPDEACDVVLEAYERHRCDKIITESNQGGDWMEALLRQKKADISYKSFSVHESKRGRAEPVSALYEQKMIHHVGVFNDLEDQQCTWTGPPMPSPNELDSVVNGFAFLFDLHSNKKKAGLLWSGV